MKKFCTVLLKFNTPLTQFSTYFRVIMSLLTRNAMRLLRNNNWSQIRQMSGAHSDDGWKIWKKVFFLVAIPVIVVGHVNAFVLPDPSDHHRLPRWRY